MGHDSMATMCVSRLTLSVMHCWSAPPRVASQQCYLATLYGKSRQSWSGHAARSPPLLTAMHSNNMSTTFATQAVAFVHSTNWNREKKFMEKNLPLREAVQQLLNRRGETKYGLAKAMGVNPQSFDTTLKRNVTITTFVRIAEGLGITPGQLMDEVMKLRP